MFRNAAFASLIALSAISVAQAADRSPQLVNQNGQFEVVYDQQPGNVVGGAYASVTGAGYNGAYQAVPGGRTETSGFVARLIGTGDDAQLVYSRAPETAAPLLASRR